MVVRFLSLSLSLFFSRLVAQCCEEGGRFFLYLSRPLSVCFSLSLSTDYSDNSPETGRLSLSLSTDYSDNTVLRQGDYLSLSLSLSLSLRLFLPPCFRVCLSLSFSLYGVCVIVQKLRGGVYFI